MAKVTLNDSPAAQVIAQAASATHVIDAKGRRIDLKRPGVLAQFRLVEALGDTSKNEVYVRMVMPLLFVTEIDGDPVLPLTRKSDVEALIQRLDEAGVVAVGQKVQEAFGAPDPDADKAKLGN